MEMKVRSEVKKIVVEYVPQIQTELQNQEDGFNQWEQENRGPNLIGSEAATRKETAGRNNSKELSAKMLKKLDAVPNYELFFHEIENPTKMVENPYPGFMTTKRARNYCAHLLEVFG